ncbi:DUF5320 domain-containing protein [Nanoarchaeota archaeon]
MPMKDGTGPRGMGAGTGWGRGPCGAGRQKGFGQGLGRRFCAGLSQEPVELTKEEEKKILKAEKESLEQELELIKKKLAEE